MIHLKGIEERLPKLEERVDGIWSKDDWTVIAHERLGDDHVVSVQFAPTRRPRHFRACPEPIRAPERERELELLSMVKHALIDLRDRNCLKSVG